MRHKYQIIFLYKFLVVITIPLFGQIPDGFYDEKLSLNFDFPMGTVFDERGNMFVWEKKGRIYHIDLTNGSSKKLIIDITEEVSNWDDHGLISIALDPLFDSNGFLYLLYSVDMHHYQFFGTSDYHPDSTTIKQATFGRVSRLQVSTSTFDEIPNSKKHILGGDINDGLPLMNQFHGLGKLQFGTDGTLLISVGNSSTGIDIGKDSEDNFVKEAIALGLISQDADIGSYRSQYIGAYGGKILRIDPSSGAGVPSNPFFNALKPHAPQSRIWSLGFRNPFQFTIIPNSGNHSPNSGNPGTLIVSDVGDASWEEINLVTEGGQNFGWPIMEGYELNWPFFLESTPENQLSPNPLFNSGNCDHAFFSFRDLLKWYNPKIEPIFSNPCAISVPIPPSSYPMIATPPTIAWSHNKWNGPARAEIPEYDNKGEVFGLSIESPNSRVKGNNFDGFSSISGVFYEGTKYPSEFQGKFFTMDHSGWIKAFEFDTQQQLISVSPFHDDPTNIIHLSYNPVDECLYYVTISNGIHRIGYGGTLPPKAIIEANQSYGVSPLLVEFDGTSSNGFSAPITNFQWDFSNGITSNEPTTQHQFVANSNLPEKFEVSLTVKDSLGNSNTAIQTISLNNSPPDVHISSIMDGDRYPIDKSTLIRLAAEVEDKEHSIDELQYQWNIFFHHNDHFHPEPQQNQSFASAILTPVGCDLEEYWYRIQLKVEDPDGLIGVDEKLIYPDCMSSFVDSIVLTGALNENTAQLSWQVYPLNGPLKYEVQKSVDFIHFEVLERGEITKDLNQYLDHQLHKGKNIYRIKLKDETGAFRYSDLIVFHFPPKGNISIFPNPSDHQFNLAIKDPQNEEVRIKIFNSLGQLQWQHSWLPPHTNSFSRKINTLYWPSGLYYYRVENGTYVRSGSIFIQ